MFCPIRPPHRPSTSRDLSDETGDVLAGAQRVLAQRLTDPNALTADLRDLPAAALDDMPASSWQRLFGGRPKEHPQRLALGSCSAATVNRALAAIPRLQACSVDGIAADGDAVDLSHAPDLRYFETSSPAPPLVNRHHVPVLMRPAAMRPSFLPPPDVALPAWTEKDCIDGWRQALSDDACRLRLIPAPEMRRHMVTMIDMTCRAFFRIDDRLNPFDLPDARFLATLPWLVPSVLLPAPTASVADMWRERLTDPGLLLGIDRQDVLELQRLVFYIDDVIRRRNRGRRARSGRDLTTMARLMCWGWPDAADYFRPAQVTPGQRARHEVVAELRRLWDERSTPGALARLLTPARPFPGYGLLQRMDLMPRWSPLRPAVRPLDPLDPVGPVGPTSEA